MKRKKFLKQKGSGERKHNLKNLRENDRFRK
jgi:hypothetical protein